MEKQLDIFQVKMPDGADCALRKANDLGGVTEYERGNRCRQWRIPDHLDGYGQRHHVQVGFPLQPGP